MPRTWMSPGFLTGMADGAGWLNLKMSNLRCDGEVSQGDAVARALVRSVLFAFYRQRYEEFKSLCALFYSKQHLTAVFESMVRSKFPTVDLE